MVITLIALLMDRLLGEAMMYHPLVGFGRWAVRWESWLRRESLSARMQILTGGVAVLIAVGPWVGLTIWMDQQIVVAQVMDILLLYFALGLRSLQEHGEEVAQALRSEDLPLARERVGMIVSRNTSDMDSDDVSRATVESVLENGNDAVVGTLFWFFVFGGAGAVLYRLVNTLDAMWGYRVDHYLYFGRVAAKLDDLLNWMPARLTVALYALGNWRQCWHNARVQGGQWDSPNAGPVMASGATALGVELGGTAIYGDLSHERPHLGSGPAPGAADISRALKLVHRAVWYIALFMLLVAGVWTFA
ncbi:MAG: adenosylcobinamide-phosphate synthase CbiB [Gammaproteobacteria bacterium]|nr:adenosylcobinamide-phosphate synthase CbiB [Gammaproteobacteria bacterium]